MTRSGSSPTRSASPIHRPRYSCWASCSSWSCSCITRRSSLSSRSGTSASRRTSRCSRSGYGSRSAGGGRSARRARLDWPDGRQAESEIAAIFTRLGDEVRRATVSSRVGGAGGREYTERPRVRAERTWVRWSAERPYPGPARSRASPTLRDDLRSESCASSMRWYVEPLAAAAALVQPGDPHSRRRGGGRRTADVARLERRVQSLEERHDAGRPEGTG